MNNLFQNEFSEDDQHPPREQLLLYVDRELTPKEAEQVQAHLGACWWCRAKVAMIEETIAGIIRFDDTVLTPHLTPPPQGWRGFGGQLNRLATEMGGRSLISHVRGWLGGLLPSAQQFSLSLQVAGRLAAALLVAVIITAVIIQSSRDTVVSASELLRRAATAEVQQAQSVAQPVVYQKIRVRRKAVASSRSSSEATATLEIWNDLTNSRFKQAVDDWSGVSHGDSKRQRAVPDQRSSPAILVEIENALRANHFDSSRLLSAEAYQAWRDSTGPKDEKVEKTKLTDGSEALSLTTVVRGTPSSGTIAEAGLVVRARDWHPVAQRLRVKAEDGDQEYELTEMDFQVVGLEVVGSSIFADETVASLPPETPSPSPRPSPAAAATTLPIPVPVDLEAAEIEVRVALERLGADLGEPIEIVRQSEREVAVRGLVNTSERKAELIAALRGLPNVKATIRTVQEASREAQPAATPSTQSQPSKQPTPEVSSKLPAQELLEKHFSKRLSDPGQLRDAAEQFSKQALAHSENALAEAWALRRLAERYTPEEVKRLSDSSRRKLEAIVRHHLTSLHLHITRAGALVKPVLSAVANEPSGAIAADSGWEAAWPEFSAPLLSTVQHLDRLMTALFTVSTQARGSPSGAAGELLGAVDVLESQLPQLEKKVAGEFLGNPESLFPKQP